MCRKAGQKYETNPTNPHKPQFSPEQGAQCGGSACGCPDDDDVYSAVHTGIEYGAEYDRDVSAPVRHKGARGHQTDYR